MSLMSKKASSPYLFTFLVCFLLWLLLTGSLNRDEVLAGLFISVVVSVIAAKRLSILNGVRFTLKSPVALIQYLGYFFKALFIANIDLAKRILSPDLPINPGMVEVETTMQSDLGKLLLANSITLTPGTLTVDVYDNRLLVHWINCESETDIEAATKAVASQFEYYIKGFLK
jgi:multicomponent Na+:H+ antiporter subunit E